VYLITVQDLMKNAFPNNRDDLAFQHFSRSSLFALSCVRAQGSDLRRREEAPWTRVDTSAGGMNKKQRLSTRQSYGV
jgi:hypothetical protein